MYILSIKFETNGQSNLKLMVSLSCSNSKQFSNMLNTVNTDQWCHFAQGILALHAFGKNIFNDISRVKPCPVYLLMFIIPILYTRKQSMFFFFTELRYPYPNDN